MLRFISLISACNFASSPSFGMNLSPPVPLDGDLDELRLLFFPDACFDALRHFELLRVELLRDAFCCALFFASRLAILLSFVTCPSNRSLFSISWKSDILNRVNYVFVASVLFFTSVSRKKSALLESVHLNDFTFVLYQFAFVKNTKKITFLSFATAAPQQLIQKRSNRSSN